MLNFERRMAAVKLIGQWLNDPDGMTKGCEITMARDGAAVVGSFVLVGPLADFFKEVPNVQRQVELEA